MFLNIFVNFQRSQLRYSQHCNQTAQLETETKIKPSKNQQYFQVFL